MGFVILRTHHHRERHPCGDESGHEQSEEQEEEHGESDRDT